MQPVSSSNISAIGYDSENATLAVLFNNGGLYNYFSVTAAEYETLANADSKGTALAQHIKGRHSFQKLS